MKPDLIEIRAGSSLSAVAANTLAGYAAVYGSLSQDLGGFVEIIHPGAFTGSLTHADEIRALYEHDQQRLLGRVGSGTLKLQEDSKGLYFELLLPDTTYARDVVTLVRRGDIAGCSIGFRVAQGGDKWDYRSDGKLLRELTAVELHEITITGNPAYRDTTVALRSMAQWQRDEYLNTPSMWLHTV